MISKLSEIIRSHQNSAPVNVVALAKALGLTVYSVPNWPDTISGMIKKDRTDGGQTGFAIYVNATHAITRRRFTVAHEIAHYVLHENLIGDGIVEDALLRASGLSTTVEKQANQLAANILMPWHLLEPAIAQGHSIEQLASIFQVSRDAMSYRVLGISYDDAQARGRF